jgi:CheY-like chemotaxis protein
MLAFADSGCGMDDEVLSHIFDPFFTTKPLGCGTGLGLSTVFGIIKQHKGFVDVTSQIGAGTTFTVYLPESRDVIEDTTHSIPEMAVSSRSASRILVVEDNRMILDYVQILLEGEGHTVLTAETPGAALELSREGGKIDLLLSDVVMPQMNGPELYERILETRPGLKVMYMSGYPDHFATVHGAVGTSVNLIAKPFTSEMLLKRISSVLSYHP